MRKAEFAALLFIFLISTINSTMHVSSPREGERMQVLIDGYPNCTMLAISPSGDEHEFEIINGQGSIIANEAGVWRLKSTCGNAAVYVAAEENNRLALPPQSLGDVMLLLLFAFGIASIFGAVAFGAHMLLSPKFRHKNPTLSKVRKGKRVEVVLYAGSKPISNAWLHDSVGPEWSGHAKILRTWRVSAGDCAKISYEYSGELCGAYAELEVDGKMISLKCEPCAHGGDSSAPASQAGGIKRKLERA